MASPRRDRHRADPAAGSVRRRTPTGGDSHFRHGRPVHLLRSVDLAVRARAEAVSTGAGGGVEVRGRDVPAQRRVKLFKIPTLALMAPMLLFVTSLILFAFVGTFWARNLGYGVTNASYLYTVIYDRHDHLGLPRRLPRRPVRPPVRRQGPDHALPDLCAAVRREHLRDGRLARVFDPESRPGPAARSPTPRASRTTWWCSSPG